MKYVENILSEQSKNIKELVEEALNTKATIRLETATVLARFVERIKSILNYVTQVECNYKTGEINIDEVVDQLVNLKEYIETKYTYEEETFAYKTMNSIVDVIEETLEALA